MHFTYYTTIASTPFISLSFIAITMSTIHYNSHGGVYESGKSFTDLKWTEIMTVYADEVRLNGCCSVKHLSELTKISTYSAAKAIGFYNNGKTVQREKRGTKKKGVGSLKNLGMEHHAFIYELYLRNPSRPADGYICRLCERYGIHVSSSFILSWFHTVGPFKGTMRVTSTFPPDKDSPRVQALLDDYVDFVNSIEDHRRLVFADEKPMKEIDIYGKVRRDPMTGHVLQHRSQNANTKIRFNIFSATTLKFWLLSLW